MKNNFPVQRFVLLYFFVGILFISSCSRWANFPKSFDRAIDYTNNRGEAANPSGRKTLEIRISNLYSTTAPIQLAFYSAKNDFLSKTDRYKVYKFTPSSNTLKIKLNDLEYGEFAIAGFQDVNSDGKCNTNFLGIPEEPYGFSNDIKPTLRAPTFKECKFVYDEGKTIVTVTMISKK